jgi:hypothetical protein
MDEEGQCLLTSMAANSTADFTPSDVRRLVIRRFKKAICSAGVILFSNRLVVRRHRRDAAKASKVFFIVAMDEEGWCHDAHGWVALQDIHGVKPGLTPHVRQVPEIPAHEVVKRGTEQSATWRASSVKSTGTTFWAS